MLKNLALAGICVVFAGGFVTAKSARLDGQPVLQLEKQAIHGAGCSAKSANTEWYCSSGFPADCTGCGCSRVYYPVGTGPVKTNTTNCADNPQCTTLSLTNQDCKGH